MRGYRTSLIKSLVSVLGCISMLISEVRGVKKHEVSAENKLLNYLLEDYHVNARPKYNPKGVVNVTIDMAYNQILHLFWVDETLTWNPADHDNITLIHVFPEVVWKPDIILYNRADQDISADNLGMFPLSVTANGGVAMLVPHVLTSSCIVDITHFPFDVQMCPLKFGSWGIDGTRLDIYPRGPQGDTSVFLDNGQWVLESLPTVRTVTLYGCCPEPYPDVSFEVHLTRKPLYYVLHLLLPSFMISFTSVGTFLLPSESGEKVTLSITVLLAATFFLMIVGDIMPATSNSLPIIGMLFLGQVILMMGTTIATVLVVNVNLRGHYGGDVPEWLRWCAFTFLARLLCMREIVEHNWTKPRKTPEWHGDEHWTTPDMTQFITNLSSNRSNNNANLRAARHLEEEASPKSPTRIERASPKTLIGIDGDDRRASASRQLDEIVVTLRRMAQEQIQNAEDDAQKQEWVLVSVIMDRLFLCLHLCIMVALTAFVVCFSFGIFLFSN